MLKVFDDMVTDEITRDKKIMEARLAEITDFSACNTIIEQAGKRN